MWWGRCLGATGAGGGGGAEGLVDIKHHTFIIPVVMAFVTVMEVPTYDSVKKIDAYELFHSQSSQGSLHSHRSHSQGTGGWPGQQHP